MEYHLVILVHGLWGNLSHFSYVKSQLESIYDKDNLVIYKTGSNEGYKTYDGIDICGKRVAHEIEMEIKRLNDEDGARVTRISVIGYSLGGLMARYAIGILYIKGYFNEIEPVNFTTFCTPHVGVLTPGDGISIRIFNWLVPFLLANTGRQIFLKDKSKLIWNNSTPGVSRSNSTLSLMDAEQEQKEPLLLLMSNPASIFFKSLKLFKYKSLYANVVNDKRTSWWTSGISMINPFEALDVNPNIRIDLNGVMNFHNGNKFKMSYLDGYSPIIIDSTKNLKILTLDSNKNVLPKIPAATRDDKNVAADYAENFFKRKFKWLIVIFNIVVYAPMWVTWFIITNLIERFKSGIRVLKENDAGAFWELYQLVEDDDEPKELRPSISRTLSETYDNIENKFEQNLQEQTEELMESVWDAMMSKKIHNDKDHFWFNEEKSKEEEESTVFTSTIEELANYSPNSSNILSHFKLNFNNKSQYDIIKNLNTLNWQKFPIYLQLTNATHSAAIVRHNDKNFKEGEVVIRHFCDEIFQLN